MTAAALSEQGVRGPARRLGRSPAALSAAVSRFESEIAAPLMQRAGATSVLTLEAQRLSAEVRIAADCAIALVAPDLAREAGELLCARRSIRVNALQRLSLIAEVGSIRRAAQIMNLGQPQLASQIRRLERELNATLLVRSHDGVALTAAGRRVLSALPALEQALRSIFARSSERFRTTNATLRIAAVTPLGHESNIARLLAFLVASWRSERPGQPLFVCNGSAEDLIAGLIAKRYDLVLIDSQAIPADLERSAVVRSPLVLIGAPETIGPNPDVRRILRSAPLALTSRRTGLRQSVDRALEEILPRDAHEALAPVEIDSIPVAVNLMLDFGYVSILPASALDASDLRFAFTPLPSRVDLTLWLVWSRTDGARRSAEIVLRMARGFTPPASSVSLLGEAPETSELAILP